MTNVPDWGDEVMPGVQMIRRRAVNPHTELAKMALQHASSGAPIRVELNLEKIYDDLSALHKLIDNLERSNESIKDYLIDECQGRKAVVEEALARLRRQGGRRSEQEIPAAATELCVRHVHTADLDKESGLDLAVLEAFLENEHILVLRKREKRELQELVRMHKCGHDHGDASRGDECNHHHHDHHEGSDSDRSSSSSSDSDDDADDDEEDDEDNESDHSSSGKAEDEDEEVAGEAPSAAEAGDGQSMQQLSRFVL